MRSKDNPKVAAVVLNYNMPEAVDALVEAFQKRIQIPYDLHVIDNGSDLVPPSKFTTDFILDNAQTTGGWLYFLEAYGRLYDYVWLIITSASLPSGTDCPLTPLVDFLDDTPNAVAIHPALTPQSTTSWDHLKTRGGDQPRETWMVDTIAPLYRMSWFKDHLFDKEMVYAWGIDLETCYLAREEGRSLWVHEGSRITKITNTGYTMNRMNMTAVERSTQAGTNMREVMSERYGPGWWKIMTEGFVERCMR
jgi:hypothetical protein